MRENTPWGESQGSVDLAEGIKSYHTASHGGIWLSKQRQKKLGYSSNFLKNPEWWEEDCDWAVPYVFFSKEIGESGKAEDHVEVLKIAIETVKTWHSEFWKSFCTKEQ